MASVKKYSLKHARNDLPRVFMHENKTRGGKCLIVAGSTGQWGAAILCAQAAARIGSGYVYVFDKQGLFPTCQNPDFLVIKKLSKLEGYSSVAVGPGYQNYKEIVQLIKKMQKLSLHAVVLDAEALNALATLHKPIHLPADWIITPHEGELSRLLKISAEEIRRDRKKFVRLAQKKFGCIVLLKGHKTLVASAKTMQEIQSGNVALAKAGTGDVLTGVIAGLLSQGLKPIKAACLGAFAHGYIADHWLLSKHDALSLMASDLILKMPKVLKLIR